MQWNRIGALGLMVCALGGGVARAADFSWPEPLTLVQAIALADSEHPDLRIAQANVQRAQAQVRDAESQYDITSALQARARWIEPPVVAADRTHDDHKLSLYLRKRLYDFGRTAAGVQAAQADAAGQGYMYHEAKARNALEVMAAYFDVLLADLQFARDNEAMATAYVQLDRSRARKELGQLSDIELLDYERIYQKVRRDRYASQMRQRGSRARLATALNHPNKLPSELEQIALPAKAHELPDFDQALVNLDTMNPELQALALQVEAARQRVDVARAQGLPLLNGEIEVSRYTRESGANDEWRAGVVLDVPLLNGGGVAAVADLRQAELRRLEALRDRRRMEMQQALLEVWLELETLRAAHDEVTALKNYRELYLDRSRALYEQEVKSDLGDAMVQISDLRVRQYETEYKTQLALARWNALQGKPVYSEGEHKK